jgi:hypothetical protein
MVDRQILVVQSASLSCIQFLLFSIDRATRLAELLELSFIAIFDVLPPE